MGWELRNGRPYYYSARKQAGRVVKTYHGFGRLGEMAEVLELEARRRRADRRDVFRAERARTGIADEAMKDLDRASASAIQAALIGAGYHRVNYTWRRRRVRDTESVPAGAAVRG
jgi:hypothetical protein